MLSLALLVAASLIIPSATVKDAFHSRDGAFILLKQDGRTICCYEESICNEKLPPCSTFKIWNAAVGLETGLVSDPDALFWKWDGQKYSIDAWDHDQTLRSAFASSCVPAYQALARKTGPERMAKYLHKISYGNEDISSGIDVFWLPAPGRKSLLISPAEQAELIAQLLNGKLPFSPHTVAVLKDIMKKKQADWGTLYGKTGTGDVAAERCTIGWFVGYAEIKNKAYPFACLLKGTGITGKDARTIVETIFSKVQFP